MLRTGFTVYAASALHCFESERDMDSDKESKSTNSIIFSGSKVEEWFKFDRQVLRWVRRKHGEGGVKLWNESTTAIDPQSVNAIAQDT